MPTVSLKTSIRNPLWFLLLLSSVVVGCGDNECSSHIGVTNFTIEPNSAEYSGLNNVGGYEYCYGGYAGVVVIRTSYNQFVAYERACPMDDSSRVSVSAEWGSSILECPTCHSAFIVEADGMPVDGSATNCPLYQYATDYDGRALWIY